MNSNSFPNYRHRHPKRGAESATKETRMLWSDRPNRLTGIILIAFAACILLSVIASIATSEADPFKRDEIDDLLIDIEDNKGAMILSIIFSIVDGLLAVAAAAALYVLFRDRSRLYALFGLAFILTAQAAFLVEVAGNNTLINLASDFAEGGPEGFAAGDPAILRDARSVAILVSSAQILGITALCVGIIAFSVVFGWAPLGAVNPPRWLAWAGLIAGITGILSWLIVTGDWAGIFFGINGIATLIWLIGLGAWLLMRGETTVAQQPVSA
jgi:Domain of unknown function (DUF4386)